MKFKLLPLLLFPLLISTSFLPAQTGAPRNSFKEVTARLDPGGSMYLYLSTEQTVRLVGQWMKQGQQILAEAPMSDAERKEAQQVVGLLSSLVDQSGIAQLSGVGASAAPVENGWFRTKLFLHHYPAQGSGFLWQLFGKSPHPLSILDQLPQETAWAIGFDADLAQGWKLLQETASRLKIPELEQGLAEVPPNFQSALGMDFQEFLNSLAGEYGMALTLHPSKKIALPLPDGTALQIPEPGLIAAIRVKNTLLFERIDAALSGNPQVITADTADARLRVISVPAEIPMEIRFTIAQAGPYLLFASHDSLVEKWVAAGKDPARSLRSNAEFKSMAALLPPHGNQFGYLGKNASTTLQAAVKSIIGSNPEMKPLEGLLVPEAAFGWSVGSRQEDGWLFTSIGNQDPSGAWVAGGLLLPGAGLMTAIAVPNFVKARETAQRNACHHNLRMIESAKEQWALEEKKSPTAVPSEADLFGPGKIFPQKLICPAGGTYTLHALRDLPECSVHGRHTP